MVERSNALVHLITSLLELELKVKGSNLGHLETFICKKKFVLKCRDKNKLNWRSISRSHNLDFWNDAIQPRHYKGEDMEDLISGMDRWMTLEQGLPILCGVE